MLNSLKKIQVSSIIEMRADGKVKALQIRLASARKDVSKAYKDLEALKSEAIQVMQGTSSFSTSLLSEMISDTEKRRAEPVKLVSQLADQLVNSDRLTKRIRDEHEQYMSWAEIFDECDFRVKKMILSQLVDRVEVSRGYDILVKLNVSMEEYMELVDMNAPLHFRLAS